MGRSPDPIDPRPTTPPPRPDTAREPPDEPAAGKPVDEPPPLTIAAVSGTGETARVILSNGAQLGGLKSVRYSIEVNGGGEIRITAAILQPR